MRALRWILGLIAALVITYFAVANRHPVDVYWSPVHDPLHVPMYLPVLVVAGVAFFAGSVMVWISTLPMRLEGWKQKRKMKKMEKQLDGIGTVEPVAEPIGNVPDLPMLNG